MKVLVPDFPLDSMRALKPGDYVWVRFADRGRQVARVIDVHSLSLTVSKYRKSSGLWTQWRYVFPSDIRGKLSDDELVEFLEVRRAHGYVADGQVG